MLVGKPKAHPESKGMKRINDVYDKIISIQNLKLAHKKACRGKAHQRGVITFKKDLEGNIQRLHEKLKACEYVNPPYKVFMIYEPKERKIFVLPYEDRIVQHAILQVVSEMFKRNLTKNTYSCIVGRGVHLAKKNLEQALKNKKASTYCLKIDITKFYPSVDHDILKSMLLRKIKDKRLIKILFEIIDSSEGLPIGNYLSQHLGNFYLSPFDHWLKEEKKVWFCARYCDDVVILCDNKPELHALLADIKTYLWDNLKLSINKKYQIFPVGARGIDFLGYVTDHDKTKIRKSIKKSCAKMMKYNPNEQSMASYQGWFKHANCINLSRKLFKQNHENYKTTRNGIK